MSTLLISLGTSPAIVPEAFLLPGSDFAAVHVITTASIKDDDLRFIHDWFQNHAPTVTLTITRVARFSDFKSEADHFLFEETLYRWWLQHRSEIPPHVCLSGGFKTMSAAMQKAAAVLGAAEVFHVLCDLPMPQQPKTAAEIEAARAGGHLHWIRLGPESGWPQLRHATAADYPLTTETADPLATHVTVPDHAFRDHLRSIVERSHHIAGAWDQLPSLPFSSLATWPAAHLDWLRQPLDPATDAPWVRSLPKIELHCHLGGFATHGHLLTQVRNAATHPDKLPAVQDRPYPPDWPLPEKPISLPAYMSLGDNSGSALLKDPGCLRKQCELLYAHLVEQNILYAEIRCSPNNYTNPERSAWDVLRDIRETFQSCMDASAHTRPGQQPACHINLLIIATRKNSGDRSDISRHLALAITAADHWRNPATCRVVGVDLAGFEHKDTRAALFATDFEPVHRVGLALTVHAGENDDAEGIWQAVFKLNARRLGHALHLWQAPDLLRAVADRRIALEMCPYANLQIQGYPLDHAASSASEKTRYPLLTYLRAGVPVTLNTDNPGISAATLTDNLLLAARLCPGLTRMDLLRLQAHAVAAAFLHPAERDALLSRLSASLPHAF